MKSGTTFLTIAAAVTLAPAALAQSAAPPQEASTPPAATSSTFTDDELQKFVKAAIALNQIQADASVAAADKQGKMVAAVQQSGLDPQKFNAIAQSAQSDPALQQRIQAAASSQSQPPQK